MKRPPEGWPRISSSVFYDDAAAAIDWLVRAFGFEVQLKVEGERGQIIHSQLTLHGGLIMVGQAGLTERHPFCRSPRGVGGVNTQVLCVFVDDAEAHCERAREAGAIIRVAPATEDYGEEYWADRTYEAEDLEGHHWFFMQRLRV